MKQPIETIQVPASVKALARRRTQAFLTASVTYPDALDMMITSAYVQGLEDGFAMCDKSEAILPPPKDE